MLVVVWPGLVVAKVGLIEAGLGLVVGLQAWMSLAGLPLGLLLTLPVAELVMVVVNRQVEVAHQQVVVVK